MTTSNRRTSSADSFKTVAPEEMLSLQQLSEEITYDTVIEGLKEILKARNIVHISFDEFKEELKNTINFQLNPFDKVLKNEKNKSSQFDHYSWISELSGGLGYYLKHEVFDLALADQSYFKVLNENGIENFQSTIYDLRNQNTSASEVISTILSEQNLDNDLEKNSLFAFLLQNFGNLADLEQELKKEIQINNKAILRASSFISYKEIEQIYNDYKEGKTSPNVKIDASTTAPLVANVRKQLDLDEVDYSKATWHQGSVTEPQDPRNLMPSQDSLPALQLPNSSSSELDAVFTNSQTPSADQLPTQTPANLPTVSVNANETVYDTPLPKRISIRENNAPQGLLATQQNLPAVDQHELLPPLSSSANNLSPILGSSQNSAPQTPPPIETQDQTDPDFMAVPRSQAPSVSQNTIVTTPSVPAVLSAQTPQAKTQTRVKAASDPSNQTAEYGKVQTKPRPSQKYSTSKTTSSSTQAPSDPQTPQFSTPSAPATEHTLASESPPPTKEVTGSQTFPSLDASAISIPTYESVEKTLTPFLRKFPKIAKKLNLKAQNDQELKQALINMIEDLISTEQKNGNEKNSIYESVLTSLNSKIEGIKSVKKEIKNEWNNDLNSYLSLRLGLSNSPDSNSTPASTEVDRRNNTRTPESQFIAKALSKEQAYKLTERIKDNQTPLSEEEFKQLFVDILFSILQKNPIQNKSPEKKKKSESGSKGEARFRLQFDTKELGAFESESEILDLVQKNLLIFLGDEFKAQNVALNSDSSQAILNILDFQALYIEAKALQVEEYFNTHFLENGKTKSLDQEKENSLIKDAHENIRVAAGLDRDKFSDIIKLAFPSVVWDSSNLENETSTEIAQRRFGEYLINYETPSVANSFKSLLGLIREKAPWVAVPLLALIASGAFAKHYGYLNFDNSKAPIVKKVASPQKASFTTTPPNPQNQTPLQIKVTETPLPQANQNPAPAKPEARTSDSSQPKVASKSPSTNNPETKKFDLDQAPEMLKNAINDGYIKVEHKGEGSIYHLEKLLAELKKIGCDTSELEAQLKPIKLSWSKFFELKTDENGKQFIFQKQTVDLNSPYGKFQAELAKANKGQEDNAYRGYNLIKLGKKLYLRGSGSFFETLNKLMNLVGNSGNSGASLDNQNSETKYTAIPETGQAHDIENLDHPQDAIDYAIAAQSADTYEQGDSEFQIPTEVQGVKDQIDSTKSPFDYEEQKASKNLFGKAKAFITGLFTKKNSPAKPFEIAQKIESQVARAEDALDLAIRDSLVESNLQAALETSWPQVVDQSGNEVLLPLAKSPFENPKGIFGKVKSFFSKKSTDSNKEENKSKFPIGLGFIGFVAAGFVRKQNQPEIQTSTPENLQPQTQNPEAAVASENLNEAPETPETINLPKHHFAIAIADIHKLGAEKALLKYLLPQAKTPEQADKCIQASKIVPITWPLVISGDQVIFVKPGQGFETPANQLELNSDEIRALGLKEAIKKALLQTDEVLSPDDFVKLDHKVEEIISSYKSEQKEYLKIGSRVILYS
jgi:hypothetical protein